MTSTDHNKTLGIFHLVYGSLHMLALLMFLGFFAFVSAIPGPGPREAAAFNIMMLFITVFGLLFTLPSLIAGYGLLKQKSWARTAAIVAGILACPGFPYGTALGVYTLWFMFGDEGKNFYANRMTAWPPYQVGALPNAANAGQQWAANHPPQQQGREREYVPPPQMPNWR
jgi:hypothetical protein